jgi:hypothetical protein
MRSYIILLLLAFINSLNIIQTGKVTFNTNPNTAQSVTVQHVINSYVMINLMSISWNTPFSLTTSYTLTPINSNQDNLTVTAVITNTSSLTFSVDLQYVILIQLPNYY